MLSSRTLNCAGGGLEKEPGTVLMPDAVFQSFPPASVASLLGSFQYTHAIVRMNLIRGRSGCQVFRTVSKNFLIRRAVIEALSVAIDHGNHVRGIFRNQLKELFALGQLAADPLQMPLLEEGLDVE